MMGLCYRVFLRVAVIGFWLVVAIAMGSWGVASAEDNVQQTVISRTNPITISSSVPITVPLTTVTPTLTSGTMVTPTPSAVSYPDLVAHFETISTQVLDTAKWVVIIIGVLVGTSSILGAYSLYQGQLRLEGLNGKVADLETLTKTLVSDLEKAQKGALRATNHLQYFLQVRDSNSDIRMRAIDQLGASNDIAAISVLSRVLQEDTFANCRGQAAYWLGRLLHGATEAESIGQGWDALEKGIQDNDELVRFASVEAIGAIVDGGNSARPTLRQKLHALTKEQNESSEDVRKAAQTVLDLSNNQRAKDVNATTKNA